MWLTIRRSAQAEDAELFTAFVSPHLQLMSVVARRFGPRDETDDIVQEALIRAWRSRGRYRSDRGSEAAWLCAITANVARRHAKNSARAFVSMSAPSSTEDLDSTLDIESAVERLTRRQREAVTCYYALGLSIVETAMVMGCSDGTVKSTLSDARSRLRTLL